ncbi:MAG: CRISPR-associated protein Csx16 [Burkholderiales bacterium]|nr:CRISPR-associated protein Csx16 [Burkholderiales bacterium]
MPKKYFVTRHRGAITWAANGGVKARKIETANFDPSTVEPGDIVMGTLPVHLAAQVNARGGHYWHLSMEIPAEHRNTELSAEQMAEFGARLEEFRLVGLGVRVSSSPDITENVARTGADLHICIASGEVLANYIPLAALTWKKVRIYASKSMKNRAAHLQGLVELLAQHRGLPHTEVCEIISLPAKEDWHSLARFAAAQAAALSIDNTTVDLNITGGTKLMSMAFADGFQTLARRLYCATDVGELQFMDAINTPPQTLAPDLVDLEIYLAAQAWRVKRSVSEGDAASQTFANRQDLYGIACPLVPGIDQTWAPAELVEASTDEFQRRVGNWKGSALRLLHHVATECEARSKQKDRPAKPFEPWVRIGFTKSVPRGLIDLVNALQSAGIVSDVGVDKPAQRESSHPTLHTLYFCWTSDEARQYAGGGYLEEYVWACVQALNLPANHYGANVAVTSYYFAKAALSESEFNEMDIAVVWANRLLAVECKAGMQLVNGKDQDIINKLDSIKDNMGGAKGRAWLVTPLKIEEPRVVERAKLNRITLVHGPEAMEGLCKELARDLGVEVANAWPKISKVRRFKAPHKPH